MKCPNCEGTVRFLSETGMFCLDCDWDNLKKLDRSHVIEVDAQWYTKTQLRKYRYWKDADFQRVPPDWKGQYSSRRHHGYETYYFYRETVAAHEATLDFQTQASRFKRRQQFVPKDEKINELAWTVCVLGDELIKHGWTYEMIDRLPVYRDRKWRKKRLFRLCDLSEVSRVFSIDPIPEIRLRREIKLKNQARRFHTEGKSYEDIANLLGQELNTIKNWVCKN